MALNELMESFEFLKTQIDRHERYLKESETRTRQVLIDPLLKELGWDVTDPTRVELEFRIEKHYQLGRNYADYVLKVGERPIAVIEAKKLGSNLLDQATNQVLNYANSKGVPWMLVTDGDSWDMYDVFRPVPLSQKVCMSLCVSTDSAAICALGALRLWRPNLSAVDGPVEAGEPSLVPLPPPPLPPPPPPPPPRWHKLSRDLPTDKKPTGARFGNDEKEVDSWITLHVAVGQLLVANSSLSPERIQSSLVSDDQSQYRTPREIAPGMYVEGHGGSKGLVSRSVRLCEAVGIDPASVEVCFD